MSAELGLIVRAAAPVLDAHPVVPAGIDWDEVLRVATWHRVGPLLYRYVRRDPALVPEPVLAELRAAFDRAGARNVYLRRELDRVAEGLARSGIPVMPLKGMALLETCYRELGLRPMVDVDALIPTHEWERAGELIAELGYTGYKGFTADADGDTRGPFVQVEGVGALDLHSQLSDVMPHFDEAAMWARACPSERGPYVLPTREDLFIHVAIHFVTHRRQSSEVGIGQLADMAWIVVPPGFQWEVLTARAIEGGVAVRVHLALVSLRDVLHVDVPAAVLATLQPAADDAMIQRFITERVLATREFHPPYLSRRVATSYTPSGRRFGRLVPSREFLEYRFARNDEANVAYARLYVRRVRRAAGLLAQRNVVVHEQLHRWINALDT